MATSNAKTPDDYIAGLPAERRDAVATLRDVVRQNLPDGYAEGMDHGMIAWYVPLETFPDTYNGEPLGLAALASQKGYISLYLNNVYGDPATEERFKKAWAASGKKLDMGKSCVRIRKLEDVPLDVVGQTIADTNLEAFLDRYREVRASSRATRARSG